MHNLEIYGIGFLQILSTLLCKYIRWRRVGSKNWQVLSNAGCEGASRSGPLEPHAADVRGAVGNFQRTSPLLKYLIPSRFCK